MLRAQPRVRVGHETHEGAFRPGPGVLSVLRVSGLVSFVFFTPCASTHRIFSRISEYGQTVCWILTCVGRRDLSPVRMPTFVARAIYARRRKRYNMPHFNVRLAHISTRVAQQSRSSNNMSTYVVKPNILYVTIQSYRVSHEYIASYVVLGYEMQSTRSDPCYTTCSIGPCRPAMPSDRSRPT